jgi:hypothetical protein
MKPTRAFHLERIQQDFPDLPEALGRALQRLSALRKVAKIGTVDQKRRTLTHRYAIAAAIRFALTCVEESAAFV